MNEKNYKKVSAYELISNPESADIIPTVHTQQDGKKINRNIPFSTLKGDIGPEGPAGPEGPQGPQGDGAYTDWLAQGNTGSIEDFLATLVGPQGEVGPEGPEGPQGQQGSKGDKGDKGDSGSAATVAVGTTATGSPGTNAAVTNSGSSSAATLNFTIPRGPQGPKGDKGPKGDTGDTGPQGEQGIKGETGDQGPQGIQGPAGADGADGTNGVDGAQGEQGPQGIQGDTGPKGDTGDIGPEGPQGPQGTKGDKGDDGTGVTILGTLANESELPGTGNPGDAYMIGGNLWVWSDTTNDWVDAGSIKGPQGEEGPQGAQGIQGPKGDKGDKGDTGLTGNQGIQGEPGPKGDKGDKGDQGPAGTGDMLASTYDPSGGARQVAFADELPDAGVTDHGALTGLGDDDHPQYHNDTRGDARYYTKTAVDNLLDGFDTGPAYIAQAEAPIDTSVLWVDTDDNSGAAEGLVTSVNGQTGDVTLAADDIDDTLTAHKFVTEQQLSDISSNTAVRHSHSNKAVLDGTTASYTTAEKTKLNGIAAGAQANAVVSVAGKTGAVTLTKSDVGLSNVTNTSDANKPISTAQQAALNAKLDSSTATASGMGVAVHGTNASFTRPTGFAQVTWIGTVEPANATTNDIWYNG